jgi:hypothetical protein
MYLNALNFKFKFNYGQTESFDESKIYDFRIYPNLLSLKGYVIPYKFL